MVESMSVMQIEIEESPNCPGSDQFIFKELGTPKPVEAIRAEVHGHEVLCEVVAVGRGGDWFAAQCVKIADSSEGHAFLIYGGAWGIRLRPEYLRNESWDFKAKGQWGEPFKIYGSEEDIVYVGTRN
jgi:hypothetical protein